MIKSIFILVVGVMVVTQALDCLNGPPIKNVHPSSCCKMPRIKDFSTMGDCYKKVGIDVDIMEGSKSGKMERGGFKESKDYHGPHGHHGHHGHHLGNDNERQCLDECLLTDWKVMKDGSIDVSAAIAKAKSMFMNDAKWSVILENGVTFCAAEAEKNKDNFVKALNGTKPDGMKNCSQYASFFKICTKFYNSANCPASLYTASKDCDETTAFFKQCPIPRIF